MRKKNFFNVNSRLVFVGRDAPFWCPASGRQIDNRLQGSNGKAGVEGEMLKHGLFVDLGLVLSRSGQVSADSEESGPLL